VQFDNFQSDNLQSDDVGLLMNSLELQKRTKSMAAKVIDFVEHLPRNYSCEVIGKQLIRSATSVAANYRAAGRARSKADFANKLGIVEEEADETLFWFEMLVEAKKIKETDVGELIQEVKEIVAIFSAAHKTARMNRIK
jgi:four helix bundle protein